jgi:hypothetical protein
MGILLCAAAFALTFLAARRSVLTGLIALAGIGYFYGILRANVPQAASHFIFDCAVLAFYLVRLFETQSAAVRTRTSTIMPWLAVLVAWPFLLVFLPLQDPLVQLAGLRGNIFFLPFLLIGARLTREDLYRFAGALAVLNLVAFVFTLGEYTLGVQRFFPHNANSELIYRSADVANAQFRIPSLFTGSHMYAGTMVTTLPLLIGAWAACGPGARKRRALLLISIVASILGVFAAASRVHALVLALVILATMISGRVRLRTRVLMLAVSAVIAIVVLSQARLQRFTTLDDSAYVQKRFNDSVNGGLLDMLLEYPFGNGLGGGGTSLPYFLQSRVRHPLMLENEYARILLEETCIGLCLWICFIAWFISRRFTAASRLWDLTAELSWVVCTAYFVTALLGIGLFTAIPQTMFMLLCAGVVTSRKQEEYLLPEEAPVEYAAL